MTSRAIVDNGGSERPAFRGGRYQDVLLEFKRGGVVYRQLGFIQSTNLGYNRDNIIYFPNEGPLRKNLESFITEIKRIPGVDNASDLSFDLTGEHAGTYSIRWFGRHWIKQGFTFS